MDTLEKLGCTPGPWRATIARRSYCVMLGDSETTAVCITGHTDDPKGKHSAEDALLIAACPDAYEAMITFCLRVERHEARSRGTYAQFVVILEKAFGKSWEEIKETICE